MIPALIRKFIDAPCTVVVQGRRFPDLFLVSNAEFRFPPLLLIANARYVPDAGARADDLPHRFGRSVRSG